MTLARVFCAPALAAFLAAMLPRAACTQSDSSVVSAARSVRDSAYTAAQAQRGEARFKEICANCHVVSQFTGATFLRPWSGRTAYDLFDLISTTMPFDNPGQLSRESYADVLAYVFRLNGFPAGSAELPSDAAMLKQVRIDPTPED
jgi:mono/diheme cytochrome c family protein